MRIDRSDFGRTPAGQDVDLWRFGTPGGVDVEMVSYGARLRSLVVPDRAGQLGDVLLGLADLPAYLEDTAYIGATVGRYGNRIRGGELVVDGQVWSLETNQLGNTLHGGPVGFSERVWKGEALERGDRVGVRFTLVSEHLDMGFPGRVRVTATFTISARGDLRIDYAAASDRTTVVNLTNHAYFNLGDAGTIDEHTLRITADSVTEQRADAVPTGRLLDVTGTVFDLRTPTVIGTAVGSDDPLLADAGGFDHNFVLVSQPGEPVAEVAEPTSGRRLRVYTDQPGIQLWTANTMPPSRAKDGQEYGRGAGLCLETQHFPDSPHHPTFPSTVLRPGQTFASTTTYVFRAGD